MSNQSYNVAIVGATGAVGQKIMQLLENDPFPIHEIKALSSNRSAGKTLTFKNQEIVVEEAMPESFTNIDIAFFSAGGAVSQTLAPEAVKRGAIVIDNTSAYRMNEDVPLIVPEVNGNDIANHQGIIANPNCSTIQMVAALAPIQKKYGIQQIVVSTYQSASGAGKKFTDELYDQIEKHMYATVHLSEDQIAFNVLPKIGSVKYQGYTEEEMKMVEETKKIFDDDHLAIAATCIRVPVVTAHSESIYIKIAQSNITVRDIKHTLERIEGLRLFDEHTVKNLPTPRQATNRDDIFIGRIRKDLTDDQGFHLWVVADNLRKGAALNSVQIAESLVKNNLI